MKKTLLALCAGVMALGASAATYEKGEAFCYAIDPSFKWFADDELIYNQNDNWPATALRGQADLAEGWGCGMFWFAQYNSGKPGPLPTKPAEGENPEVPGFTLAEAQEILPVVQDPWNENSYAIKVYAPTWWAYGNLNFALPKMDEVCRIRVVYRVDETSANQYAPANGKPFHVRLTDNGQDDCFPSPNFEEQVETYWTEPGYRVVDLYYNLPAMTTYLALTFDGQGLTCGGNDDANKPAFYLKEVSVVPVSKLAGNTHVSGDLESQVVATCPEPVIVKGINDASISEVAVAEKAAQGIYDLQGRKVAKAAHGLYIVNGVKTFVK